MNRSIYRSVRGYATGGDKGSSPFMSALLERVEKINLNKDRLQKADPGKKAEIKKSLKAKSSQRKPNQKRQSSPVAESKQSSALKDLKFEKVQMSNHPLFNSRLDKSRLNVGNEDQRTNRAPRSRPQKSRAPRAATEQTGETRSAQNGPAPVRPARPQRSPRSPRQGRQGRDKEGASSLISREIVASEYKPSVSNHFLHGKSTNIQIDLTSRLASIAKAQLLRSKYPFKLPQHIIKSLPEESATGALSNRFVLSKNSFSTKVKPSTIARDIDTIVKGKPNNIKETSIVEQTLNRNATLSVGQKLTMVDIISGKKTVLF